MSRVRRRLQPRWINASCVLGLVDAFRRFLTTDVGSVCTGIQYAGPHHGDEVHAVCRVFLLWKRFQRYLWTLRARKPDLHAFHESDQAIRWYVGI
jgi:hypothetical protein